MLFGASLGGKNFLENHKGQYNILAIIDNDPQKIGTKFKGIDVISPSEINNFDYDQLIIASMYINSINKQLEQLNVPKEKIKYASKSSMKLNHFPFRDATTLTKANDLMLVLGKLLQTKKHFFCFGTLLGLAREGRLIAWDDDIDIVIFDDEVDEVQNILISNISLLEQFFEVVISRRNYKSGKPASLTIECFSNGQFEFDVNFDCSFIEGDFVKHELNDSPIKYFSSHDLFEFKGELLKVPSNYREFLTYTYGDWEVPKEHSTYADNALTFREPSDSCNIEILYKSGE